MEDTKVVGYERNGQFRHPNRCTPSAWRQALKANDGTVRPVRLMDDDADKTCGRCDESLFF
jgi:hypothetical protein